MHVRIDPGIIRAQKTFDPPQGGLRGVFKASKIQNYGKYHELPRKKKKITPPHPTRVEGDEVLGVKQLKQSRKFHELSTNR